ncbi:DEAD/DEAH box helicase [Robertkochia aurantiaca]|uniref:DEAD/DEAH box helicase n=1 Tax=Robertkochia aurantiaca TaxID=2873700 RepID=UPI001CCE2ACA|nr:DEAD/DEAH box helicase [Robertkochia sp. 3YJGBD-33]
MLKIEYIKSGHLCKITNKEEPNWQHIRLFFSELSEDFTSSANYVLLPWHSFISNFKTLSYIIKKYKIKPEIEENALALIKDSIKKRKVFRNVNEIDGVSKNEIQEILNKKGFLRELKPHQKRNVSDLSRLMSGATFSVPGAGKTTEAISFYWLKRERHHKLIVISPKSAFPAWEEQLIECLGKGTVKVCRLVGGKSNIQALLKEPCDVFLISYQQFILVTNILSSFLHENECFMFLDESHRIKGGYYSQTGQQVQSISHLPVGKLIMSGTPMPNSESDLIPQFSFLFPENGDVTMDNVTDLIQTIYVRTTKPELGLKKPQVKLTPIPFSEPQRKLYNLVRSEEYRKALKIGRADKSFLRKLSRSYMRLLQISSNPSLLLSKDIEFSKELKETIEFGDSVKIDYAVSKARELSSQNKKVLIWSGFVQNVELIANRLTDLGAMYIHGGVEAGSDEDELTREWKIKEFHNNDNCRVLVANPAACSEGISLHKVCHYAIYVDRDYNAARFLQSQDRIHRLGLPPNTETTIEILYSPDSIDERIHSRLNFKVARMGEVLNDPSIHIEAEVVDLDESGFSTSDAKDLLNHLRS